MDITYDAAKSEKNAQERGLPFALVSQFDFDTARVFVDDRLAYSETRYIAVGYVGIRLHVVVFAETETGIRVISFRKANLREVKTYEQQQETHDR